MKEVVPKTQAIIYTRVSSDRQVDNMSLGEQERICREFCLRKELKVIRVFVEEGESAKTALRTELQGMLDFCSQHRNEIGHLIVYKIDRFSRKVEDHAMLRAVLKKLGIILWSASEPINASTTGMLLENVLASFAQFDNDVRAERSRGGMVARAMEGAWVSRPPIGYINVKDERRRPTLAYHPETMDNVRAFFVEFLTGRYTQTEAIQLATDKGVLTEKGTPPTKNGVIRMLRNFVYTGNIKNSLTDGKPVEGLHPGIITESEYDRVQAILDGRKHTLAPLTRNKPEWPLRRYLKCKLCSRPLTASASTGRSGKRYAAYHCARCTTKNKGATVRVPTDDAHDNYETLLAAKQPAPWILSAFKEIVIRRWNQEFREVQNKRRKLDDEIKKTEDLKNELFDRWMVKRITDDQIFAEQNQRLVVKKAELELTRSNLKTAELNKERIVDQAVAFMAAVPIIWKTASLEDKQRFQSAVYRSGIFVNPDQTFGTTELSPVFQEAAEIENFFEANKKDLPKDKSLLVTLVTKNLHPLKEEAQRWRTIVAGPYEQYRLQVKQSDRLHPVQGIHLK
jgi:site-specific DNA recombinase